MKNQKAYMYHLLFAFGIVSVTFGTGLLFVTLGRMPVSLVLVLVSITAAAELTAYSAILFGWKARIVFLSLFTVCAGFIHFISMLLGLRIKEYWPLYAVAAGLCFLPANYRRYKKLRLNACIISAAFVFLGAFLAIFSFGFSSVRFKAFIAEWWPALFIAAGLVLVSAWGIQKLMQKKTNKRR